LFQSSARDAVQTIPLCTVNSPQGALEEAAKYLKTPDERQKKAEAQ